MIKTQHQIIRTIMLFVLMVVAAASIGFFYNLYIPHSTSVTFKQYEPQILPSGLHVTGRSIEVWSKQASFGHDKLLSLDLNISHSYILENKNTTFKYVCGDASHVTNATCAVVSTPRQQKYVVTVSYDQTLASKPFEQTATWVKDGTNITMTFQGDPVKLYSNETLSNVIDSFSQVHYRKITIKHYSPGP